MSFLLDTNVVSEWLKPRPNVGVVSWLAEVDKDRVFLTVVTLAEMRYGIERMAAGTRRERLEGWLGNDLPLRFEGRILSIEDGVADFWWRMVARGQAMGRPLGPMDAFLAATAELHDLTLVTRNTADFEHSVKAILNPWSAT